MSRKKRLQEDDDIEVIRPTVEVNPEDAKVKRILSSMPGGLRCLSVFRYPEGNKGGRPSYIDDISPDQFRYQTIKEMFGGGRFSIQWDNADGSISKSVLDITGPYLKLEGEDEKDTSSEETPIPIQLPSSDNPGTGPGHGGLSPLEFYKLMRDERNEARREAREELRAILELTRPQQQSPDMTKQVFDIVEKVVSMTGQVGGDGGNPWITTLAMFKEPLTKIVDTIQAAVNRPPLPVPVHPPVPSQSPQQTIQRNPPVHHVTQEDDVITLMLRQYLPLLVSAAAKNAEPSTYADMILDQVPESQYASLAAWINRPDCLEGLCTIEPGIRYQQEWWVTLRASLIEALNDASRIQPTPTSDESEQSE